MTYIPTLLAAVVGSSTVALNSSQTCCQCLENAGLSNVLYPGDGLYEDRTSSYWSVSAQLTPNCIVQPASTAEVSTVVQTLVENGQCQFAIRSGGHTTWAGSNNIADGVTIDLGLLASTTYNEETKIASIQPGSRWGQVYSALEPKGVTVAGGRAASVGVAGFVTGGGNSFYTAQKGFSCDTVKNFEVVLASGAVINANATDNSDLFQALKGGSAANFGIVTRFDLQAFEATDMWGGTKTYSKDTTSQQIEAYVAWTDNIVNYREGSSIIFWSYLPTVGDIVVLAAFEDTAGNVAPPGFDKFEAINATASTMRIASHLALTQELEQATGYRDIWFTMAFANDARIYAKIVELHEQFVNEWKVESSDPDFITQCMFQSIPKIFSQHSVENGGNVLGLDEEEGNIVMLLFDIAVKGADDEALGRKKVQAYGKAMQEFAASLGGLSRWIYLNYADGTQNPLLGYGPENVAKIRAAATKYDPQGIFQTRAPGGFKISRV